MNRCIAFSMTCCIALTMVSSGCEHRDVEDIEDYDEDLDGAGLVQPIEIEADTTLTAKTAKIPNLA